MGDMEQGTTCPRALSRCGPHLGQGGLVLWVGHPTVPPSEAAWLATSPREGSVGPFLQEALLHAAGSSSQPGLEQATFSSLEMRPWSSKDQKQRAWWKMLAAACRMMVQTEPGHARARPFPDRFSGPFEDRWGWGGSSSATGPGPAQGWELRPQGVD